MTRRLLIIALTALLALDVTPQPAPATTLPRPTVDAVLSVAPRTSGTVVVLDVPADLWPALTSKAPLIDQSGVERRFTPGLMRAPAE